MAVAPITTGCAPDLEAVARARVLRVRLKWVGPSASIAIFSAGRVMSHDRPAPRQRRRMSVETKQTVRAGQTHRHHGGQPSSTLSPTLRYRMTSAPFALVLSPTPMLASLLPCPYPRTAADVLNHVHVAQTHTGIGHLALRPAVHLAPPQRPPAGSKCLQERQNTSFAGCPCTVATIVSRLLL